MAILSHSKSQNGGGARIKQKRALAGEETQRKPKKRVGGKLTRREKLKGESELMAFLSEVWSKEWGLLKTL